MSDCADEEKLEHVGEEADVVSDSADSDENSSQVLDVKEVVTSGSTADSEEEEDEEEMEENASNGQIASSSLTLLGQAINVDDNVIDLDQHDLNFDDEENEDHKISIQKDANLMEEIEMTAEKISDISSSDESNDGGDEDEDAKSSVTVSSAASSQRRRFRHKKSAIKKISEHTTANNELELPRRVIAEERGEVISDDDGEVMDSGRAAVDLQPTRQSKIKVEKNDGENDDLEDGELKSDSDDEISEINEQDQALNFATQNLSTSGTTAGSFKSLNNNKSERPAVYSIRASERLPENGVCRFFLRGMCTWGEGCKYFHPSESQRQPQTQPLLIPNNNDFVLKSESKPLPLFSIPVADVSNCRSLLSASGHNGAGSNVESAWERGLRQARELVKKKQSGGGDHTDLVHEENEHNGSYRERENRSTFSSSPSTSTFRSSHFQSNSRKRSFPNNEHDSAINSPLAADAMRYEEVSDDEISTTNGGQQENERYNSTKNDNGSSHRTRMNSDNSGNSTAVRHHHPPIRAPNLSSKSHYRGSGSSEDDGVGRHRLKSKVVKGEKNERLTLNNFHSSASEFSDPWARNNLRNRRVSGSSGSSKSTKLNPENFFDENEEDTPAAYRNNKKQKKKTSTSCLSAKRHHSTTERLRKISTSSSSQSSAASSRASSSDSSPSSSRRKVDDDMVYEQRSHRVSRDCDNNEAEDSENEAKKKRKRDELLQKLKSVEEAIAKKRKRIGA